MALSTFQETDLNQILQAAKDRFVMPLGGIHGVRHWQRVRANGLRVAEHSGAKHQIVELFAYLHDCCRETDGCDYGHGARAADFAETLRGSLIHLNEDDFRLLHHAIKEHEHGETVADVTVMTCWDADRLDLGRVGIVPRAKYLCTEYARRQETITWAYERSQRGLD